MRYVIGHGQLFRVLRDELGFKETAFTYEVENNGIIVNCGRNLQYVRSTNRILNHHIIFDKFKQIQMMTEAGINCPKSTTTTIRREMDSWITKPKYSCGGKNINFATTREVLSSGFYYQQFIDKTREFRGHVALWLPDGKQCFSIQEKVMPEGRESELCWNHTHGSFFNRLTSPSNRASKIRQDSFLGRIEDMSIKACKALGHDFSAMDILMDSNGKLWMIEANTIPAVDTESSRQIYRYVFEAIS